MLAPSASGHAVRAYAPGSPRHGRPSPSSRPKPRLDEHLVEPEVTRDEIVRGERMVAQPSAPEHGDRHFGIDYVLGAHVKAEYVGSTDLLTRFGPKSDFATDTCIRRRGIDPKTEDRYLEEVAFEVANTQSESALKTRAEDITKRGVRRFFAIFVNKGEVAEWSRKKGCFVPLAADAQITDPTLAAPLHVRALLDAAEADNGVARALLSKNNPVLAAAQEMQREEGRKEGREKSREEGREEGLLAAKAAAVLAVLATRKLTPGPELRQAILTCKSARTLDRWLKRAVTAATVDEVVGRSR